MRRRIDITGQRFGRLTVAEFSHVSDDNKYTMWRARCDCGAERVLRGTSLTSGNTTQCVDCQNASSRGNQRARKHGHASAVMGTSKPTRTYESWKAMMARCYREANESWQYYGGKGIVVCERWHDFQNFLADMGERPLEMTLHRLDHNGNYEKSNCEWRRWPH